MQTYFSTRIKAPPEGLLDWHFYGTNYKPFGFEAQRVRIGAPFATGDALFISPDGVAIKASANDVNRPCNAIAATPDSAFVFRGYVPGNFGFSAGSQLWLSTTDGQFTTGAGYNAGKFVQNCGMVAPDGALFFVYNPPILLP